MWADEHVNAAPQNDDDPEHPEEVCAAHQSEAGDPDNPWASPFADDDASDINQTGEVSEVSEETQNIEDDIEDTNIPVEDFDWPPPSTAAIVELLREDPEDRRDRAPMRIRIGTDVVEIPCPQIDDAVENEMETEEEEVDDEEEVDIAEAEVFEASPPDEFPRGYWISKFL